LIGDLSFPMLVTHIQLLNPLVITNFYLFEGMGKNSQIPIHKFQPNVTCVTKRNQSVPKMIQLEAQVAKRYGTQFTAV